MSKTIQDRTFDFAAGELLLINKPLRWTSFDVVGKIRTSLKPQKLKVGHAGTLDPLASGLLLVCTGKLTKQIDQFQAEEKEYTGTMILGASTPSFDLETEPDTFFETEHLSYTQILQAVESFIGDIQQYPPIHSAVKVNGERLYKKARLGEAVELRPRFVQVSVFEITRISLPQVDFRIVCSKGTYIRSLISDFGKILNNGAYLSKLVRTRSGKFLLSQAYEVLELANHIRAMKENTQDGKDA